MLAASVRNAAIRPDGRMSPDSNLLGGSMFARLLPHSVPFFELLEEQNRIIRDMARCLCHAAEMENTEDNLKQINVLEEEADALNRKITWHLSQTFITPIDREDIHAINIAQERVADSLQNLASRVFVCGGSYPRFATKMIIVNLSGMLDDTKIMLEELAKKKDFSAVLHSLKTRKADCEMLQAAGRAEMMEGEMDSFEKVRKIIVWSQAYDRLEHVVDLASDLADTLEQVVLKYV